MKTLISNGISASCWWLPSCFKATSLVTIDSRGEREKEKEKTTHMYKIANLCLFFKNAF